MLLLRSGGERALGQVITFCTNEQERVFEAVHMGVLILGKVLFFISLWLLCCCFFFLLSYQSVFLPLVLCSNTLKLMSLFCLTGTPVMFGMCVTYSLWVLGLWALLGNLVILLFYPVMVKFVTFPLQKEYILQLTTN